MNLLTALPTHFDGRRILERIPFTMPGELVVAASANQRPFAQNTFMYAADLVVELTSVGIDVACLSSDAVPIATPAAVADTLRMVRARAKGSGKTRDLFKNTQLLSSLVEQTRLADKGVWRFDSPYYLINGQGWDVEIDNSIPSASAAGGVNVAWSFRGAQLILGPIEQQ